MITFPPYPIPIITSVGDGYILYVKENGFMQNDEICVVLLDGGKLLHMTTAQVRISKNETYLIKKDENFKLSK